jgi:NAD(P)-dependent dehydrogenase (short-subunit alcohol dehydrogenase family)
VDTEPLREKIIVVIGGTSGIGLAGAQAIQDAGAKIVAVGLDDENAKNAKKSLGENARLLTGDAALAETAERAIELAIAEFGHLDGLYHVAGGSGRRAGDGPLDEVTDEGWDYTLRLNLTSQFYSNRAAVRQFLKQKTGGVVLNIGSVLAWSPSPKYFSTFAYAAAKSAIIGMTKSAAAYYAADNIRFNVIAPGLVETPMARRAVDDPRIMWFAKHKQPLDGGRIGQPGDLGGAVVYLLSDQSKFVTGQVLAIDGGWGVTEGQYPE